MSKTRMGIKTAAVVVLVALIQGALSFYRVSVIINAYGDEINGVVQVALQLSAYLVLFQTGMSAAYQFRMYEPLTQHEYGRISGLFSGLKKSMLRVSGKMLLISVVVIPVYSLLLLKQGVQYLDTVLILAAIGLRVCAPYFFTLPERCLIDIREKKYIIFVIEGVKDCATILTEVLLILFTHLPLPLILCVSLVYLAASRLAYQLLIRKYYGREFVLKAEPEHAPAAMTRAVYAHQVSSIATSNTDNVVLSVLSSLKNVTIFSAFSNLISYPGLVINRIVEGMRASLALKITRGDPDSYSAFRELLSFSFFCACTIVPVFLRMANPFVTLWIGEEYCVPALPLIFFALLLLDSLIMPVIYAARDARGLYEESRNFTIVQAVVNVVLSLSLVIPFGITGVLAGTFAALYLILQPCNFKLVYSKVFERKMTIYLDLIVVVAISIVSYLASGLALTAAFNADAAGWVVFVEKTLLSAVVAVAFAAVGLWIFNDGFRQLMRRLFFRRRRAEGGV